MSKTIFWGLLVFVCNIIPFYSYGMEKKPWEDYETFKLVQRIFEIVDDAEKRCCSSLENVGQWHFWSPIPNKNRTKQGLILRKDGLLHDLATPWGNLIMRRSSNRSLGRKEYEIFNKIFFSRITIELLQTTNYRSIFALSEVDGEPLPKVIQTDDYLDKKKETDMAQSWDKFTKRYEQEK